MSKAVSTSTAVKSFEEASRVLEILAELKVSSRHLQTLSLEIGGELVEEQEERTKAYRELPLNTPPTPANSPIPLAVVMADGGRMQTRKPDRGPGVHEAAWRETKTAILLRMSHHPSTIDPHPELPFCFTQPLGTICEKPTTLEPDCLEFPQKKGEILYRTGLASLENSEEFGWKMAAAADSRGFFTAKARAYVCDGQAYNWTIQRIHFGSFVPILDFVHAAEHIHKAAKALGEEGERWVTLCWQGQVASVLDEIRERLNLLSRPPDPAQEPEHAWSVLDREIGYLQNNQDRMDYPRYRREGLPVTSSPIESWVKQLNQRVKGSEKFWNDDANGEAILHLRTAWLGDDEALEKHLANRPGQMYGRPSNRVQASKIA